MNVYHILIPNILLVFHLLLPQTKNQSPNFFSIIQSFYTMIVHVTYRHPQRLLQCDERRQRGGCTVQNDNTTGELCLQLLSMTLDSQQ